MRSQVWSGLFSFKPSPSLVSAAVARTFDVPCGLPLSTTTAVAEEDVFFQVVSFACFSSSCSHILRALRPACLYHYCCSRRTSEAESRPLSVARISVLNVIGGVLTRTRRDMRHKTNIENRAYGPRGGGRWETTHKCLLNVSFFVKVFRETRRALLPRGWLKKDACSVRKTFMTPSVALRILATMPQPEPLHAMCVQNCFCFRSAILSSNHFSCLISQKSLILVRQQSFRHSI